MSAAIPGAMAGSEGSIQKGWNGIEGRCELGTGESESGIRDCSHGKSGRCCSSYRSASLPCRLCKADEVDRYNGFSWQTRTLEVRPDRLPPEYEPQQNQQPPVRGPVPYAGNHHHPQAGHPGPGPGWQRHPHQMHMNNGHPMGGSMSMPGPGHGQMFMPHHQQPYLNGQIHRSHSPALSFSQTGMPMPLSGQNTGSHSLGYGHMGASPLAGSLTVGADPIGRVGSSASNSNGISPHSLHLALPRAQSPVTLAVMHSRPASSQGHHSASSHGSHAHIVPNGAAFARASFSGSQGNAGDVPFPHRHSIDHGHGNVPHLEGLGHRGPGLGPPETLHDRVIFVSNVSLLLQQRMWSN